MFTKHFWVKRVLQYKSNSNENEMRWDDMICERERERETPPFCCSHSLSLVSQIKGPSLAYGVVAMSSQGWSVAMFTSGSSGRGELSNIISVIEWFGWDRLVVCNHDR